MPSSLSFRRPLGLATAGAALVIMALGAGEAAAQDKSGPDVTFNLGASTDYVFRGVSQTDEDPQVFGGVDLTYGRFYAGTWASNVDFGDSTDAEIDLYAGFKPTLGSVSLDLGVIYYGYVDAPSGSDYGNWEAKLAASAPVGPATLGAAVYYSPDGFGAADEAVYYELNGAVSPMEKVSLSAAVGRQTYDGPGDYTTWNIGGSYAVTKHVALDLRYHDTDEHSFGELYDSRVVLSAKATF